MRKIAARSQLSDAVTDVLLKSGDRAVQCTIIDNPNARVSETGFARIITGLKRRQRIRSRDRGAQRRAGGAAALAYQASQALTVDALPWHRNPSRL